MAREGRQRLRSAARPFGEFPLKESEGPRGCPTVVVVVVVVLTDEILAVRVAVVVQGHRPASAIAVRIRDLIGGDIGARFQPRIDTNLWMKSDLLDKLPKLLGEADADGGAILALGLGHSAVEVHGLGQTGFQTGVGGGLCKGLLRLGKLGLKHCNVSDQFSVAS